MNNYIAYCGLECEACEAHIATINDDNELRMKVAREWSEQSKILVLMRRSQNEGVKTPFCDSLCPIRQCALSKAVRTCGDCSEIDACEKLQMITGNNEEALKRLKG